MDDDKILADVKLKQSDTEEPVPGTLYLTFEGIAFVPHKSNKKATFLLTMNKIKNRKHSEVGPLTFVLHNKKDGPTFGFERLPLRDVTRNVFEIFKALHQMMGGDKLQPEQCTQDPKETELRANAINADIHLKKLHDELVVAEILTEFEFWARTKTWLDLSSLKIPNAQARSYTEGHSQSPEAQSGMTDTKISAIDKLADETLEPAASSDSSKLELSKETSDMESSVNPSMQESPEEKSVMKLPGPDAESQEKDAQSLADPSKALQVVSTDEPSGLSGVADAEDSQAKIYNVEAKLGAKIDKAEENLKARIDKVEEKIGNKLESIGTMLAAFIAKQGMAAADSGNLEAKKSEATQIADASEPALVVTKSILDLYPEEHHKKILQSGLPSEVKEELLFDNVLADTLMVCFDSQKPLARLSAFYKAGLLRNAMADVLEKLKNMKGSPKVNPLVDPIKKRLTAAISQFNEFVREEKRKTNKRVKN